MKDDLKFYLDQEWFMSGQLKDLYHERGHTDV